MLRLVMYKRRGLTLCCRFALRKLCLHYHLVRDWVYSTICLWYVNIRHFGVFLCFFFCVAIRQLAMTWWFCLNGANKQLLMGFDWFTDELLSAVYSFTFLLFILSCLQIDGCYGSGLFRAFNDHIIHRLGVNQEGPLVSNVTVQY